MERSNNRQKLLVRICVVGIGMLASFALAGFFKSAPPKPQNSQQDMLDKLHRIGRALQLYRAEYGVLPVDQRIDYADAGLPPTLSVLVKDPGKAWYVPLEDFQVPVRLVPDGPYAHRQLYYGQDGYGTRNMPPMTGLFRLRGERLPVLEAIDWVPESEWRKKQDVLLPIIRLDGTVEMAYTHTSDRWKIWER